MLALCAQDLDRDLEVLTVVARAENVWVAASKELSAKIAVAELLSIVKTMVELLSVKISTFELLSVKAI